MNGQFEGMHDVYNIWTMSLISFIGWHLRDRVAEPAIRAVFNLIVRGYRDDPAWQKSAQEGDLGAGVIRLAMGFLRDIQPLKIEEDEAKVIIEMHPCGAAADVLVRMGGTDLLTASHLLRG